MPPALLAQLLMSLQRLAAMPFQNSAMLEYVYESVQVKIYQALAENRALAEELRFTVEIRDKVKIALRPAESKYTDGQLALHAQMIDSFFAALIKYMAELAEAKASEQGKVFGS
jgi:hypothetical protein